MAQSASRHGAVVVALLGGCTSAPPPQTVLGPPVELIATDPAVLAACRAELSTTYCSADAAAAALKTCAAQVPADPSAVATYTPARAGPCAPGPTYADAAQCATPVADNCAFYRACLEPAHPCGATGYALAFGEPLCYLFIAHRADFSAAGQRWLQGVRTCLQDKLALQLATSATDCDTWSAAAYASHVPCYTAPGNSFCDLAPADVAALETLVLPYLDNPQVAQAIGAVAAICASIKP